jgi:4-amino-4-deoxy-L-arabinose transferase-like glycosyltransferase
MMPMLYSNSPEALQIQQPKTARQNASRFLTYLYFGTLASRLTICFMVYLTDTISFFAADVATYDSFGWNLAQYWAGSAQYSFWFRWRMAQTGFNGMFYWVAALYTIFGHSQLLASTIQCIITSFAPILIYKICFRLYNSTTAARYASVLAAFLPSMALWSSFLLKDPLVIFLVSLSVLYTLKLQQEVKLRYIVPAASAMLLIFPIRGYVFYFVLLSVLGALLMSRFGKRASFVGYLTRLGGIALIAITMFSFGFARIANEQLNSRVWDQIQISRADLARSAQSGFDADADVGTLSGALAFMPKGIAYLLFAPFPWQSGSLRMMLPLPETILWYCLFPFCIIGIIYTVRKHLRDALVIFLFVVQLTCFYGIFVGNVGTAYRQRTQVYVFYLIFTAAGLVYVRPRLRGLAGTIADKHNSSSQV